MKRKKWKTNYYILAFLIFIGLILFIDLALRGFIGEYFEKNILFDREKVLFSGVAYTRGTLYWPRLKSILIYIVVGGFIILEIAVYFASKYSQKKESEKKINQIERRISLLTKKIVPEEIQELKPIDFKINEVMYENELVKKEISMEMQKKNDLITYLAHDLKTPLASIIGYLTILDESEVPKGIRQEYIRKLLEKSYRLEELTNQFFDITRFSLHEIPLNKKLLDAQFFLEQLTEELYPLLKKKNLKFDINLPSDMKIYVDGSLFARALNNLLKNAIMYSYKDSTIQINGKLGKLNIQLSVENDGNTISNDELKLIFEKFYRVDQSRSQSAGAGLGLAIAKEIIQKHKGSIDAKSYDRHTVFIITLPNS